MGFIKGKSLPALLAVTLLLVAQNLSFAAKGVTPKTTVKPESFTVDIVEQNGQTMKSVTNFRAHLRSYNCYSTVYTGVPTVTDTYWAYFDVETGPYAVRIPFDIITHVTVTNVDGDEVTATVFLGDGTTVAGKIWYAYQGQTDLGTVEFEAKSIKELTFAHKAKDGFTAKPCGKHKAILTLNDGRRVALSGAAFLSDRVNKNGCYIGYDYPETFTFCSNDINYTIPWSKIKAIVPTAKGQGMVVINQTEYKLVTQNGQEMTGYSPYIPNVYRVEGVAPIGKYTLSWVVSFFDDYQKLELQ